MLDDLIQLLENESQADRFTGAVLIHHQDERFFSGAYGYANRSWKVANQINTRFRIASISKIFTAVAVLQLIDQGKLSLDSKVIDRLELQTTSIPPEATIFHLLTMTSGMADWFDESGDWEEDWAELCRTHPIYLFRKNADYLPLFINQPPVAPVGQEHRYNGAGYILLGLIIEQASGLPYTDFIEQNIFHPAGMKRTGFPALDDVEEEIAEGYLTVKNKDQQIVGWKKNIYSTTPAPAADGGATSTAPDLVRFSESLRKEQLLSPELTAEFLLPKVLQNEDRIRGYTWKFGYGITFLLDKEDKIVRWGITGEEDGISCRLYYYPEMDLDVVILGNQSWCAGSLGWKIHNLIIDPSHITFS